MYTLIETLKALGWIETRDAGDHETLQPTSAGADALAERVEAEVRGGDLTGGPSSVAALAYLSIMSPGRAAEALRARATAIGDEARRLQEALDGAGAAEIHMIEVHYLLSRLAPRYADDRHGGPDRNGRTRVALNLRPQS